MSVAIIRSEGVPYLAVNGSVVAITEKQIQSMKKLEKNEFTEFFRRGWMPTLTKEQRNTLRGVSPAEVYEAIQADASEDAERDENEDDSEPPILINPATFGGPKKSHASNEPEGNMGKEESARKSDPTCAIIISRLKRAMISDPALRKRWSELFARWNADKSNVSNDECRKLLRDIEASKVKKKK